jgi:hypothetical protein
MSYDPFATDQAEVHDPFADGAGGGPPCVKFVNLGDTVSGIVRKIEEAPDVDPITKAAKTWPDGKPKNVFIFYLDTPEGERRMFVRGNMVTAIRNAAKVSGVRSTLGHTLHVKHHELGEQRSPLAKPAKLFVAKVDLINPGQPRPAPVQQAAPPPVRPANGQTMPFTQADADRAALAAFNATPKPFSNAASSEDIPF